MTSEEIRDCLKSLPHFASVPLPEFDWVMERGGVRVVPAGTVAFEKGGQYDEMLIMLGGRAAFSVAPGETWRTLLDAGAGAVIGAMPFSRALVSPGNVLAEQEITAISLHRRHFADLVRECPALTAELVHRMVDRVRDYHAVQLNEDRMQAMGRLASGLAHELNNPAAGASRSAQSLLDVLDRSEGASQEMAAARLTEAQIEAIDAVRRACTGPPRSLTALETADREETFTDWLSAHGIDTEGAEALATSDIDVAALERLVSAGLQAGSLGAAVVWLTSGAAARSLALQIASATRRIHSMVDAIKGFTFLDRDAVPDDVDVVRGLTDTIAVLGNKARSKSVDLQLTTADGVPTVYGFGAEINQVWEKLLDNAIDAAGPNGKVAVTVSPGNAGVIVRVTDSGAGIPEENRIRIFDPFFTTKPLGQGIGLGLTLVRRVVDLHNGEIDLKSEPGRTEFAVQLPKKGARSTMGSGRS